MRMLRFLAFFKRMGVDIRDAVNNVGMSKERYSAYITSKKYKQQPFFYYMWFVFSHIRLQR